MPKSRLYGKPKQIRYAGELIAKGLRDIKDGHSSGDYPALDSIMSKKPNIDICTPDCLNHIRGQQEQGLIADIFAPPGERLAVVEHRISELKESFDNHRSESIRAGATFATKSELKVIDKHIDRDIVPAIDKLASRSTLKTAALVVSIIGLLVSMAYNVINLYKTFHS